MTANAINKRNRIKRAIMLCDIVIEDLHVADLDMTIHKHITTLHQELLIKHRILMEEEHALLVQQNSDL